MFNQPPSQPNRPSRGELLNKVLTATEVEKVVTNLQTANLSRSDYFKNALPTQLVLAQLICRYVSEELSRQNEVGSPIILKRDFQNIFDISLANLTEHNIEAWNNRTLLGSYFQGIRDYIVQVMYGS